MDPHYLEGSDVAQACHRKGNNSDAGKFGALNTNCDTPVALVDGVFDFMKTLPPHDFILFNGDAARHNRDKKEIKRSPEEVYDAHQYIQNKFTTTFTNTRVFPVLGNNDVLKNNDVAGNDPIYEKVKSLWEPYHLHLDQDFTKGGYYIEDLIPGKLKLINTNTMLFIMENELISTDCDVQDGPGAIHIDWLQRQLQDARTANVRVYLSVHVPPNSKRDRIFYKPVCYYKYFQLLGDYGDVILGHFSGHFNNDILTAVVDGPGFDQCNKTAYGHANVSDSSGSGAGDGEGEDNNANTSRRKRSLVKRKKKNKLILSASDVRPPYGHIALLGHPLPLDNPPMVKTTLFGSPSIIPLNNPGFRVYEYETSGQNGIPVGTILNYHQYYADLQEANKNGRLDFKLEYHANELYGVPRFDAAGTAQAFANVAPHPERYEAATRVRNPLPAPLDDS
ncbi:hypothetical protein DM01DRAFT_1189175 [Hesseltinella vesiculosa]|uniref:Sphingomyelin phosphodiesterase C-terminal domain-containing protein n=1 Tax=Hesseltinella vesiculosa TaxID=101127 RepID=A0A1X2GR36_9FUNG|nr:hypothetical protein DM01DRAFT_1189175 [Hesseltinella vesiculosa]